MRSAVAACLVLGCGATSGAPSDEPLVGTATAKEQPTEAAGPSPKSPGSKSPTSKERCPAGMALVDGDYCTEVEHRCLIEWFAPQNKKRVCEQFEASYAKCVGSRVHKRYCIDLYEWPNDKGERPEVMNNFHQAQVKCASLGKRLCTETEWSFACEGPQMKPFPYGFTRDPRICNGDHQFDNPSLEKMARRDPIELARLWKGVRSGSQPKCVSDFGVFDMPGNADEVCANESKGAKHSAVHTGGPWYSGVRNQCRPKVYTHGEETFGYFLSFRCCAAADGGASDPRTPKQIREGVSWATVERIAGFTIDEMRAALERKARGACRCESSDVLCKTMCGTLLGPGAVDASDATRVLHPSRKRIRP